MNFGVLARNVIVALGNVTSASFSLNVFLFLNRLEPEVTLRNVTITFEASGFGNFFAFLSYQV